MEIETFGYVLNLTSEQMQRKRKNSHPTAQEERLELTLWHAEIIFFQPAVIYFRHNG
jgi:hypothetical protein